MRMLYFTFNFSKTVIKFSIKKYSMSKVFSMYGLRTLNMGKKMELKDLWSPTHKKTRLITDLHRKAKTTKILESYRRISLQLRGSQVS